MAGGLADGAARVGAQGERRQVGGHRCGGTAAGAAGNPVEVPRVPRRLKTAVLSRRAHRELVHIRLAEEYGVGGLETLDDRGIIGRYELLENLAAAGCPLA